MISEEYLGNSCSHYSFFLDADGSYLAVDKEGLLLCSKRYMKSI